jgi:hypothetical protein
MTCRGRGALASLSVADDLRGVVSRPTTRGVGIVDRAIWKVGEFAHPLTDIVACVEFIRLAERGHDPAEHIRVDTGAVAHLSIGTR